MEEDSQVDDGEKDYRDEDCAGSRDGVPEDSDVEVGVLEVAHLVQIELIFLPFLLGHVDQLRFLDYFLGHGLVRVLHTQLPVCN